MVAFNRWQMKPKHIIYADRNHHTLESVIMMHAVTVIYDVSYL